MPSKAGAARTCWPGLDGNDRLAGGAGDDFLLGGAGADSLDGGAGTDMLEGGAGADSLTGGLEDTASYQSSAAGVTVDLTAGTGLGGDAEGDTLQGIGNLLGSAQADSLTGSAQANALEGGAGDDVLRGLGGDDLLEGGLGADQLEGGAGADRLVGDADDTASYASSAEGVLVDLEDGRAARGDAEGDVLTGIGNLTGSAQADALGGDAAANSLDGGAGNDVIDGRDGDDTLQGGLGSDLLQGGAGDDLLYGGPAEGDGPNLLDGGRGDDRLFAGGGGDLLIGGVGDDWLTGGAGADSLEGGSGDDVITTGGGADSVEAGKGDDLVSVALNGLAVGETVAVDAGKGDDGIVVEFADPAELAALSLDGGRGEDRLQLVSNGVSETPMGPLDLSLLAGRVEDIEEVAVTGPRPPESVVVSSDSLREISGGDSLRLSFSAGQTGQVTFADEGWQLAERDDLSNAFQVTERYVNETQGTELEVAFERQVPLPETAPAEAMPAETAQADAAPVEAADASGAALGAALDEVTDLAVAAGLDLGSDLSVLNLVTQTARGQAALDGFAASDPEEERAAAS